MVQDQIQDAENAPQGMQPRTAPSLMRLDAGDAEFLGGVGPDFVAQSS